MRIRGLGMKTSRRVFLTLFCLGIITLMSWVLESAFFGDNVWRNMRSLRRGDAVIFEKDLCGGYNFRERALLYGRPFPSGKEICGRLNFQNKTLEVVTGEVLYVGNDPHFFPSSEEEKKSIELDDLFKAITHNLQDTKNLRREYFYVLGYFWRHICRLHLLPFT